MEFFSVTPAYWLKDENAIRGERAGGKNTTDPEGRIDQRFLYPQPSGGFLHVNVAGNPVALRLALIDDEVRVLYRISRPEGSNRP